jgi:hypothetical protein
MERGAEQYAALRGAVVHTLMLVVHTLMLVVHTLMLVVHTLMLVVHTLMLVVHTLMLVVHTLMLAAILLMQSPAAGLAGSSAVAPATGAVSGQKCQAGSSAQGAQQLWPHLLRPAALLSRMFGRKAMKHSCLPALVHSFSRTSWLVSSRTCHGRAGAQLGG